MLVENVSTESVATPRMVYNYMKVNNLNAEDTEITQQFRRIVKGTRQYYRVLIRKKWLKCYKKNLPKKYRRTSHGNGCETFAKQNMF